MILIQLSKMSEDTSRSDWVLFIFVEQTLHKKKRLKLIIHTWNQVRRSESKLLDLCEIVLRISVQGHTADLDQRVR